MVARPAVLSDLGAGMSWGDMKKVISTYKAVKKTAGLCDCSELVGAERDEDEDDNVVWQLCKHFRQCKNQPQVV